MYRTAARAAGGLLAGALLAGCITTPITGRRALNAFSLQEDMQLGTEAYQKVKNDPKVKRSGPDVAMVERCMSRLVAVADDPGFDWEVVVIDDPKIVNAFALPGGKMAVYTGILPVAQTETGLAVVMGHEIAHAVARHGTERMTRAVGFDVLVSLLSRAAGGDAEVWSGLADTALQLTFELPHGREQESEADHIGLIYMARAGYDPREAIRFWERMEEMSGGGAPPEFLSTHPSHETRVEQLQEWLPEALAEAPPGSP